MCDLCQRENMSEEVPLPRWTTIVCGWSDEFGNDCQSQATHVLRERYVDEHLCEEHGRELAQALGEGLMELLQQTGVSEGETLKPISPGQAVCDSRSLIPPGSDKCKRPAVYANVTFAETPLCDEHRGFGD